MTEMIMLIQENGFHAVLPDRETDVREWAEKYPGNNYFFFTADTTIDIDDPFYVLPPLQRVPKPKRVHPEYDEQSVARFAELYPDCIYFTYPKELF